MPLLLRSYAGDDTGGRRGHGAQDPCGTGAAVSCVSRLAQPVRRRSRVPRIPRAAASRRACVANHRIHRRRSVVP